MKGITENLACVLVRNSAVGGKPFPRSLAGETKLLEAPDDGLARYAECVRKENDMATGQVSLPRRDLGESLPHRFIEPGRKGLFRRLFGGRAA